MEIREWVRAARKRADMTMEQLGEAMGRSKGAISHWETGKYVPSYEQIKRISDLTGYPMPDAASAPAEGLASPAPQHHGNRLRPIWVCGTCQGGIPERVWEGNWEEVAQEFAWESSSDPKAFLCEVVGMSMYPRYKPREFALIEPSRSVELEEDVLVRLDGGETMLKRLLSRRDGRYRFGSYNDLEVIDLPAEKVVWIYRSARPVERRDIYRREDLARKRRI
jgi:phage repressor protein C with HTH and peptisase S24 domain